MAALRFGWGSGNRGAGVHSDDDEWPGGPAIYMYICCHAAASDMFLPQSFFWAQSVFLALQYGYSVTQTHPIVFSVSSLLMMIS
jgi:hypothetical protein